MSVKQDIVTNSVKDDHSDMISQTSSLNNTATDNQLNPLISESAISTIPTTATAILSTDTNKSTTTIPVVDMTGDLVSELSSKTIRTTCPYCGVGCGVLATVRKDGTVSVAGDPNHPANFGKLCSKGSNLAQTLGTDRRITQPYYQDKSVSMAAHSLSSSTAAYAARTTRPTSGANESVYNHAVTETDWETVLDDMAERLNDTIAKHGRDSVMFYVSGQLLTEDYYVANKFIKGFIGNNNIDSNSRLCMSSAVAGHKRAFGADLVPGSYNDFESCGLLVLVGSNMAWCHPILFGRFLKAKQADPNKKLIVIDPRRTDSCEFADLHLPIAAGTDTHLYNGLLRYLEENDCRNKDYAANCEGLDEAVSAAQDWTIDKVASATQVDAKDIEVFYKMVATHQKTVTAFSMGVNQSSSGTDKVNAIINTHLLTGRVGIEGASPFSLTGQPNAMGGREVGALANLLAAHLDLNDALHRDLVADFWQAPQAIAPHVGVKACDAADAILDGRIKAIWIMATNPVVSLPEADKFRQALAECDLVIVSECSKDSDTVKCADIVLPAQGWGEKSGTVTNSERRITRQRSLLTAAGEAKPDWWILSQVATRMGMSGFDYQHPSDIFNEHTALTSYRNDASKNINESNDGDGKKEASTTHEDALIHRYLNLAQDVAVLTNIPEVIDKGLTPQQYDDLAPFQWGDERIDVNNKDVCHQAPQLIAIAPPTDAGAVNVYQPVFLDTSIQPPSAKLKKKLNDVKEIRLITGRLRDQWHTMTRTGLAPKLNQQQTQPTITLNPDDAKQIAVTDKDFVSISPKVAFDYLADNCLSTDQESAKALSTVLAQVEVSDDMRVGDAFMPMHWSNAFASLARVGAVIPTKVDPISAQPELKNSAVCIQSVTMHAVGIIMVHIDWLDAVLVQLRTLMSNEFVNDVNVIQDITVDGTVIESTAAQTSMTTTLAHPPNIVWSLSRQQNSVLINVATPSLDMSNTWLTNEFWHSFLAQVTTNFSAANTINEADRETEKETNKEKNMEIGTLAPYETSVLVDMAAKQLRLIITQAALESSSFSDPQLKQSSNHSAEHLKLAVYIAPQYEQLPSTHWLNECFADMSEVPSVKWLLAGRPASGYVDPGPIVCACMGVGENIIIDAITSHSCIDALTVGKLCQAGTNCGSCVGQINELIKEYA